MASFIACTETPGDDGKLGKRDEDDELAADCGDADPRNPDFGRGTTNVLRRVDLSGDELSSGGERKLLRSAGEKVGDTADFLGDLLAVFLLAEGFLGDDFLPRDCRGFVGGVSSGLCRAD